ncbi:hypothetical protein [Geodermatophilus ruber]|uniref:Uncharacterized protein n=1 Tax=Geodermatophilus ruber TaxID=504800 RepID=A0A1I4DW67_9ACTN|nr:hypothetical protein [Geodermatophilus ruber]SFK97263.1 hypothetical protein SAMN04488085_10558 [Geodermatophilus ruber]
MAPLPTLSTARRRLVVLPDRLAPAEDDPAPEDTERYDPRRDGDLLDWLGFTPAVS